MAGVAAAECALKMQSVGDGEAKADCGMQSFKIPVKANLERKASAGDPQHRLVCHFGHRTAFSPTRTAVIGKVAVPVPILPGSQLQGYPGFETMPSCTSVSRSSGIAARVGFASRSVEVDDQVLIRVSICLSIPPQ